MWSTAQEQAEGGGGFADAKYCNDSITLLGIIGWVCNDISNVGYMTLKMLESDIEQKHLSGDN